MATLYKILSAPTPQELQNKVTGSLDSGWFPRGGVAVSTTKVKEFVGGWFEYTNEYHQAMVKGSTTCP